MESNAQFFRINMSQGEAKIAEIQEQDIHNHEIPGIKRRSLIADSQECPGHVFEDKTFSLPSSNQYSLVRLYDLYEETEVDLFPKDRTSSSLIDYQNKYNSFLAESGLLDIDYLKTIFLSKKINEFGYYKYFVKRDGEYYINCVDDVIPVDKKTKQPLWGLSKQCPWQLVLLKAWLKQKRSWTKFQEAEPFEFLQAFGFPVYKNFNFKKQIDFLKVEKIGENARESNLKNVPLNSDRAEIIAKTVSSPKIEKIGLPANLAAFKLNMITDHTLEEENIYQVTSSVPVSWTGKNSLVLKNKLQSYLTDFKLNLENAFIMTQSEVLKYFSKFYVIPSATKKLQELKIQDVFYLDNGKQENWIQFTVPDDSGLLSLSFELPKSSADFSGKYSDIVYFLSKKNTEDEMQRSHIRLDVKSEIKEANTYIESDCDKWEFYQIDYHRGYSHNCAAFTKINPGDYILYTKVTPKTPIKIRFNSQVYFTKPQFAELTGEQIKVIFDSTFYGINKELGIETSLGNQRFQESISFANTFDEIGFGCIGIKTLPVAKHKIAMRVFPEKLKQNGMDICDHYYEIKEGEGKDKNFVLVSQKGFPQIIVLKKINNDRDQLNKPFPPEGTVQFFKLSTVQKKKTTKSRSKSKSYSKIKSKVK